jgi:hypothetical protein
MESILTSIKLLLLLPEDYDAYDPQVIMHINSVFTVLKQLGVGPEKGFRIEDKTATWSDYITETEDLTYDSIKSYIGAKVRLLFDPPNNSAHIQVLNDTIKEFEYRLNLDAEFTQTGE